MQTAAEALEQHGLNGERFLGIARDVANNAARRIPYASNLVRDELVSFLVEQGLRAATRYDTARSADGYSFPSYLWDVMSMRVPDFYRRKAEGFGDRRSKSDNRIVLQRDPLRDDDTGTVDHPLEPETPLDSAIELADDLEPASAWTLVHLAGPIAAGWRLTEAAAAAGITDKRARLLLDELQDELGHRLTVLLVEPLERWTPPSRKGIPKPRKKAA